MTEKISGSYKLKRNNLPKFNHDIYPVISSSSLILYSVHYLSEQKAAVRLEDVVFTCFTLFPQKFALKKYPRWPDSALVSRHLGDCRGEGYIAANMDSGFKLTVKGLRLAEKTAKILGVSAPERTAKVLPLQPKEPVVAQVKKLKPVAIKEKMPVSAKIVQDISSLPKAQVQKQAKDIKTVPEKKVNLPAPLKKVQISSPNMNVVTAKPARKEKVILPTPVKKIHPTQPKVDVVTAKPVQKEEIILPAQMKKVQASGLKVIPVAQVKRVQPPSKKEVAPVRLVKKAQPVHSIMAQTMPVKNIKTPLATKIKPAIQPDKTEPTQLTLFKKVNSPVQNNVSQEVKTRAGKFVRLMERSDAYIHYKKNVSNSKISEFDFRSLLLCTMESSAETLARNVELFKGYAEIHARHDLMTFLAYCEEHFSHLLKPQIKLTRKAKK